MPSSAIVLLAPGRLSRILGHTQGHRARRHADDDFHAAIGIGLGARRLGDGEQ